MAFQELAQVGAAGPARLSPNAVNLLRRLAPALAAAQPAATRPMQLNPNAAQNIEALAELRAALAGAGRDEVAAALAVAGAGADNGVLVVDKQTTRGGEVPAGFKSTLIAAGDTFTFELVPPALFKPKRLMFKKTTSPSFELVSCVAGMDSLMITADPIPCEVFNDESFNQGWRIDTLQIGQPLKMVVRNTSEQAEICSGAWLGLYAT